MNMHLSGEKALSQRTVTSKCSHKSLIIRQRVGIRTYDGLLLVLF